MCILEKIFSIKNKNNHKVTTILGFKIKIKQKTKNDIKIPFIEIVKQKIDNAEVVSFDIFDTLLVRPYVNPNDLFDHLGELENIHNFRKMREIAFEQAIHKYKNEKVEEVTLEQIYEFLPKQIQYLKEKELELEYKVLQQNFEIKEVYDYAISKNKKIILISDMFLPKDFIESVLSKNGYTNYYKLYLSSEIKKLKFTSNLYRHVLNYPT